MYLIQTWWRILETKFGFNFELKILGENWLRKYKEGL